MCVCVCARAYVHTHTLASAGVIDVVCQAIPAHSSEVTCAGCRILRLLARDPEN